MSLVMLYICSKKEGSVVNLDLEDAISWSFHFMIYMFSHRSLGTKGAEDDEDCLGMQWQGRAYYGGMGSSCSVELQRFLELGFRVGSNTEMEVAPTAILTHEVLSRPSVG
jgi:hypothetical protein